jgi:electron transport complex protein RnfB
MLAFAVVVLLLASLPVALFIAMRSATPPRTAPGADAIDKLLPQTQCGQCGHMGCRPYAEAIAAGEAINRCPPGGERTIRQLADLLQIPAPAPDFAPPPPRAVAFIREAECIGCTKCIQACPVDAIIGAAKLMHTVIAAECTGCDLCVEPCPVDCIEMRPLPPVLPQLSIIASDMRELAI